MEHQRTEERFKLLHSQRMTAYAQMNQFLLYLQHYMTEVQKTVLEFDGQSISSLNVAKITEPYKQLLPLIKSLTEPATQISLVGTAELNQAIQELLLTATKQQATLTSMFTNRIFDAETATKTYQSLSAAIEALRRIMQTEIGVIVPKGNE